jgi:hypothetical protein
MKSMVIKSAVWYEQFLRGHHSYGGRATVEYNGKSADFDFEVTFLLEGGYRTRILKHGCFFYYRANPPDGINSPILTGNEEYLVANLLVVIIETIQLYERGYRDPIEKDILPEKESDQISLLSVLEDNPLPSQLLM